jgi:hypothetical protein
MRAGRAENSTPKLKNTSSAASRSSGVSPVALTRYMPFPKDVKTTFGTLTLAAGEMLPIGPTPSLPTVMTNDKVSVLSLSRLRFGNIMRRCDPFSSMKRLLAVTVGSSATARTTTGKSNTSIVFSLVAGTVVTVIAKVKSESESGGG